MFHGGNTNTVVRVGDTVRRTSGPWTPTVHSLLRQLEDAGFEAAPRALGRDADDREVLSFIEGDTVDYPMPTFVWSDETLVEVGRLLRRYHDVTAAMTFPNATWRPYAALAGPSEVICHCDWGPYNAIFRDGPVTTRLGGLSEWVETLAAEGTPNLNELLGAFRSAIDHVGEHARELERALS